MTEPPVLNVSRSDTNGFLSAMPKAMNSTRGRSSSVTPSVRTEVYEDPEVVRDGAIKDDNQTRSSKKKQGWFDRLLGYFGLCRKEDIPLTTRTEKETWASPWVLPVVVLSPRKDTDRVQVKRVGKCTIDTGNTQGNIVSRTFVEDVLEYPRSAIRELTEEEKEGGSGVTGHRLVPEGAIFLTWYHKKSTRVFHNMRFLISEHPGYDLIIGARSIQEHGIQDVPNLIAASTDLVRTGRIVPQNLKVRDPESDELRRIQVIRNNERRAAKELLEDARVEKDQDLIKDLSAKLVACEQACEIADRSFEWHKASSEGNLELAKTIKKELDRLVSKQKLFPPTTTKSTGVSDHQEAEQAPRRRI